MKTVNFGWIQKKHFAHFSMNHDFNDFFDEEKKICRKQFKWEIWVYVALDESIFVHACTLFKSIENSHALAFRQFC